MWKGAISRTVPLPHGVHIASEVVPKEDRTHTKGKRIRGDRGDPIITLDYMWMKDRDLPEEYNNPIIVLNDNTTNFKKAHVVRTKGVNADAINLVMEDLKYLGYTRLEIRVDQENSIRSLRDAIMN